MIDGTGLKGAGHYSNHRPRGGRLQPTRLVEHVLALGLGVQLASNGAHVTAEITSWLKALDAEVPVSLDAAAAVHDRMCPGQRAFDRAIAGIRALARADRPLRRLGQRACRAGV